MGLGVGSRDCWGLAEPPSPEGLLAQKGVPSCLGPWTPHRFRRAPADEYSLGGGLAPTTDSCASISRPPPCTDYSKEEGYQCGPIPVSTTGVLRDVLVNIVGGHVSMPGCLLGQLRGCLNVVTGTGESDCCVTGCSCNGGVAVTHCFFVALSKDCGPCVAV